MIDALLWLAGEPVCAPREAVTAKLERSFGETAHEGGIASGDGGGIAAMYVSEETGTWTMLLFRPDGSACLIASGSNWGAMPGTAKGEPT